MQNKLTRAEVQPCQGQQTAVVGASPASLLVDGKTAVAGNSSTRAARMLSALAAVIALGGLATGQAVHAQDLKGDPEAAKAKISNCTGCHSIPGYRASFPSVYRVPYIAGQSEKYLVNALIAYRKGDRSHPTMRGIAGSLSDQDIADIAAFYAQSN